MSAVVYLPCDVTCDRAGCESRATGKMFPTVGASGDLSPGAILPPEGWVLSMRRFVCPDCQSMMSDDDTERIVRRPAGENDNAR